MVHHLSQSDLSSLLPGSWLIAASNLPRWLSGDRTEPRVTFVLEQSRPVIFATELGHVADGQHVTVPVVDTERGELVVRRGTSRLARVLDRWQVTGINAERTLLVVRHLPVRSGTAGIDLMVRVADEIPELRKVVAATTEELGLSREDFASLGWLG